MNSARGDAGPLPTEALRRVPGVAEAELSADDLARLPDATPPPPWDMVIDAVLWVHRPGAGAGDALHPAIHGRRPVGLGIAGFVRYRDSPVGTYRELLASPTLVRGGLWRLHVPLIAVDHLASLHSGRAHWALPKMLAAFEGTPGADRDLEARGAGWWVRAGVRPVGPTLPLLLRLSLAQAWPDGSVRSFPVTFKGRVRFARVDVAVDERASFASWLRSGRHTAMLLTATRMRLAHPRRAGR